MIKYLASVCLNLLLAGCSSSVTYISRSTGTVGRGTAEGFSQTLQANIGSKTCRGEYTTVPAGGSMTLINAYGVGPRGAASVSGTATTVGLGGTAAGFLQCSDGDVLRCEIRYAGTRGVGVCIGGDNEVYDVIAR